MNGMHNKPVRHPTCIVLDSRCVIDPSAAAENLFTGDAILPTWFYIIEGLPMPFARRDITNTLYFWQMVITSFNCIIRAYSYLVFVIL